MSTNQLHKYLLNTLYGQVQACGSKHMDGAITELTDEWEMAYSYSAASSVQVRSPTTRSLSTGD